MHESFPPMRANAIRHWRRSELPVTRYGTQGDGATGFDFTLAVTCLCRDLCQRLPDLAHIEMDRVLVCATVNRSRSLHGLQARITPMRFAGGALLTRRRGRLFGIERYFVDGQEMLYILALVLPRLLHRSFNQKLNTIIHELYHISPHFNGDVRRFPGRCSFHSSSKDHYERQVQAMVRQYQSSATTTAVTEFLHWTPDHYLQRYGSLWAIRVPRPRMVPIGTRALI